MAFRRGRGSRKSREKKMSWKPVSLCRADLVLQDLGVEELLAVLPLVEGLGLVQALVALHADQGLVQADGDRAGEVGLADPGGAFDEDRLAQVVGQVDRRGDLWRGDVAGPRQHLRHRLHRGQARWRLLLLRPVRHMVSPARCSRVLFMSGLVRALPDRRAQTNRDPFRAGEI
jgi:hypothetical protein